MIILPAPTVQVNKQMVMVRRRTGAPGRLISIPMGNWISPKVTSSCYRRHGSGMAVPVRRCPAGRAVASTDPSEPDDAEGVGDVTTGISKIVTRSQALRSVVANAWIREDAPVLGQVDDLARAESLDVMRVEDGCGLELSRICSRRSITSLVQLVAACRGGITFEIP